MILNSIDKQFALSDDGHITWQKDLTNPMPGEAVATIQKGTSVLEPKAALIDAPVLTDQDKEAVLKHINEWLTRYVRSVLEPLFKLKDNDIAEGAPKEIAARLYDAMGILPRADLDDLITKMEEEGRATLRKKKIRFGPLIVFLPELNKPVAVRLRALLLTLHQDKDLPAEVPADGIVSFSVEGKDIDKNYYRAIGYPVYGPRSVRVDMLDRVICTVYDNSKEGKFQAQHQMAEWLGSNIADLYAVLEAMGHKKIYDPAEQEQSEEDNKTEDGAEKTTEPETGEGTEPKKDEKPELATFRLKRGKASEDKKSHAGQKPFKKKPKQKTKKENKKQQPRERVYTAEAESKPEDSPFAVLQQLKVGQKD
jgi:ATP-dependent RNA helicase SUPV3L1/SUV3